MTERKPFPFAAILFIAAGVFFFASDFCWGLWLIGVTEDFTAFWDAFDLSGSYFATEIFCFVLGGVLFCRRKNFLNVIVLAILSALSAWGVVECIYWVLDADWAPDLLDYADCFVALVELLAWVVLTVFAVFLAVGAKEALKLWFLPGCIYAVPMLYYTVTNTIDIVKEYVFLLEALRDYGLEYGAEFGNQSSIYASVCCYEIYSAQALNAGIFLLGLWFYKMAKQNAE